MLSYGALEKSNNPHIESVVEPCFSESETDCGFDCEENPDKVLRQWKKVSMS